MNITMSKSVTRRVLFALLLGLLASMLGGLAAQVPTAVPVEQEPQHKVVFKNDFVRIIDATLPPGYVTLNHTHAADNVAVTISNGREGEARQRGLARAGFSKGGYSHVVTNSGPGIMRYIVVEPLKSDRPDAAASSAPPHHTLETENERVRIYRIKLAAGESLDSHTHATGRVEVTVGGAARSGTWSWIGGGQDRPVKVQPTDPALEFVEIEPK